MLLVIYHQAMEFVIQVMQIHFDLLFRMPVAGKCRRVDTEQKVGAETPKQCFCPGKYKQFGPFDVAFDQD
jgi:hypothetical protein